MANKILLADDSITIQKVVNLTFTDEGINVVTVGNGELALKKLGEEQFDLVLADIFMPGRNGYEVCEYVKSNPATRGIPVILLVGAFEPFDKSEAARVQADGHLTKPFESRILIETVKRMLAEAAVRNAAAAPPPAEPEPAYKGQVVGWDVPTSQMAPQTVEEQEPEPPPYDPYASTAKLPPLHKTLEAQLPPSDGSNRTQAFGAPLADNALFTPGDEPTGDVFSYTEAAPEAPSSARAIEGPPDAVPGFSFNMGEDASGPLQTPPAERPSFGYQQIPSTDSPLDLPDITVVESHTHEPAAVSERRDPLLETFADVTDSTAAVDGGAAPGLEINTHADTAPSHTVGATEGIISAWDPQAQPPAPPVEAAAPPPVEIEAPPADEPAAESLPDEEWSTQPFSVDTAPFVSAEDTAPHPAEDDGFPAPDLGSPFELPSEPPADERGPSKATVGLADLAGFDSYRTGNSTERFTSSDVADIIADHTAAEEVEAPAAEPEPVAEPPIWHPEVASAEPVVEAEAAPVEEAAPEAAPVDAWSPIDEPAPFEAPEPVEEAEPEAAPVEEAEAEIAPVDEPAAELEPAWAAVAEESAAVAEPEAEAPAAEAPAAEAPAAEEPVAAHGNGSGSLHAIPQDVIDEVVRRTVDRINDDVIREIAWEVVPQLAESLIKKRLSERG